VPAKRPKVAVLFGRALLLRCAWCGRRRGIIRGWFRRHERCQQCGMSVQRGDVGFELGAATVNVMLTFGALIAAAAVSIIMTYPDVETARLLLGLGVVAVILPIVLYPFTYTIWFAMELLMDPPSEAQLADAERAQSARAPQSPPAV
jgi:uncharacterized protein (DUF983 family)